jgi:hypothetical protein
LAIKYNGKEVIMKTTNDGLNWTAKYTGINSADPVCALHFRGAMGYAVTSSGKILKTFDKGESWVSENSPATNGLYALYMVNDNTGYAGGVSGTLIKRTTNNGIWVGSGSGGEMDLEIYPNPVSSESFVKFSLPQSEFTTAGLYDLNGRLVKELISETLLPGEHSLTFERNQLKPGIYYLHLVTSKSNVVQQVQIE